MPQLPPAPRCPIPLPAQPQIPPTFVDIANAIEYSKNIQISQEAGVATKADVANAAIYEAGVIAENARPDTVAPPWFGPATIGPAIAAAICPLTRIIYTTHNLQCGDGHSRSFQIVPFVNGDDPTGPSHNLPALDHAGSIDALTGAEAAAYLTGYNLPVPRLVKNRRQAIRNEIGCSI